MSGDRRRVCVALGLVMATVSCAACSSHPAVAMPPTAAPPQQVLQVYLKALKAGDCDTTRALATDSFARGNGELCGDVVVKSFNVAPDAARTADGQLTFGVQMVTEGSGDGSIPLGNLTWFYRMKQQPTGSWRLVSGGSGP